MKRDSKFELEISEPDLDVAYVLLPDHPGRGTPKAVVRSQAVSELVDLGGSIEIVIDFDANDQPVGIEILL